MDTLRHAFTKSRSSSSASSPPPLMAKPPDSTSDAVKSKSPSSPQREESTPSKRDSGLGKSVLSTLGSTNGRKHSRQASGASSRSMDHSFVSNGSMNGNARS
jgi:hypothetical protein